MLKRYTSFSFFISRRASTTSISSMISLESTVSFGQVSIPRIFVVARFPVQHIRRFVERERGSRWGQVTIYMSLAIKFRPAVSVV